jgi:NADH:ubiquinone oxidoreductase subunit 2 (subunit N)
MKAALTDVVVGCRRSVLVDAQHLASCLSVLELLSVPTYGMITTPSSTSVHWK